MSSITIIGQGNVGTHLCVALSDAVDELISISSRTLEDLPLDSDAYLIAVSDDAIEEVAAHLPKLNGIVAHTSGSKSIDILSKYFNRYGVFYPLQTFTKYSDLNYSQIPVFIEGSDTAVTTELMRIASLFTSHIHRADSALRRRLHVSAVLACNYTNHLWYLADSLLQRDGLSLEILRPLIDATIEKLRYLSPADAQTGPAARGDMDTIQAHMEELANTTYGSIYKLLAESILNSKKQNSDIS